MPQFGEKPTIITLQVHILPQHKLDFINWQVGYNSKFTAFPGFVSLEFLSAPPEGYKWFIVQRFSDLTTAKQWQESETNRELIQSLEKFSEGPVVEVAEDETTIKNGVTEVFITEVNPEMVDAFRKWSAKIHEAEAKFSGFRGVYVQSPPQGKSGHWITLLQFDTMNNLDRWLQSPERLALIKESAPVVSSLETHRVISPYAGWFASIARVSNLPPAWKQSMITLLVLFPIVMLELKYLNPLTAGFGSSLSTFIGNALSVALISFPVMPIAIWLLGWWLSPDPRNEPAATRYGTLLVILLYLIEIAIFWFFL